MKMIRLIFVSLIFLSFSSFAESGRDIFDRYCTVCHSPSMAPMFNSPAAHDLDAWKDRKNIAFDKIIEKNPDVKNFSEIDKEEQIINELLSSAINGTDKGMPPKGTCSDCTDEELRSVIKFMSSIE
jgi:cytochrome c5